MNSLGAAILALVRTVARAIRRAWESLAPRRIQPRDRGERAAARELQRRGWEIVEANVMIGKDEADLVCRDERGMPVLVEVKSSLGGTMAPELQVGPRKQAALRRLALKLAQERRMRFNGAVPRIDVVIVRLDPTLVRRDFVERHLRAAVADGPRRIAQRGDRHFGQRRDHLQ